MDRARPPGGGIPTPPAQTPPPKEEPKSLKVIGTRQSISRWEYHCDANTHVYTQCRFLWHCPHWTRGGTVGSGPPGLGPTSLIGAAAVATAATTGIDEAAPNPAPPPAAPGPRGERVARGNARPGLKTESPPWSHDGVAAAAAARPNSKSAPSAAPACVRCRPGGGGVGMGRSPRASNH